MSELFERFAALTGLSTLLGPGLVRRALADLGTDPERAASADYLEVLPRIEMRMRAYLAPGDIETRLRNMRELLAGTERTNVD